MEVKLYKLSMLYCCCMLEQIGGMGNYDFDLKILNVSKIHCVMKFLCFVGGKISFSGILFYINSTLNDYFHHQTTFQVLLSSVILTCTSRQNKMFL